MNDSESIESAYRELCELTALGPRFHGTQGVRAAADWIQSRIEAEGLAVRRQQVALSGWTPGERHGVHLTLPIERDLPAWPMLGSGGARGARRGSVTAVGPQGLWGDSMVWQRFLVTAADGQVVGYLHARDDGPAAPQPLPSRSDRDVAHLAIGHLDGRQLTEWIQDGFEVAAELHSDAGPAEAAVGDNLIVDLGARTDEPHVVLCAHYDTFYNTVGAYDNGSGTVALLRLAREWARRPAARPLRLIFFTGEEWHLGGSRHYVTSLSDAERASVQYLLNLDGLGRGSLLESFAAPEAFERDVHALIRAHAAATRPDLAVKSRFPATRGTDDASFQEAGIPSVFVTFNDLHRLHQPEDVPNLGIASNIVWTTSLVRRLVDELNAPDQHVAPGLL